MATITSNSRYIEIDGRTAIALSDNAVVNLTAKGVRVGFKSGSYTDIGYDGTTVDGETTETAQDLYDWFKAKGFKNGGGGGDGATYTFESGISEQGGVVNIGMIDDSSEGKLKFPTRFLYGEEPNYYGYIGVSDDLVDSLVQSGDVAEEEYQYTMVQQRASGIYFYQRFIGDVGNKDHGVLFSFGGMADVADYSSEKTAWSYVTKKMLDDATQSSFMPEAGNLARFSPQGLLSTGTPLFPENAIPLYYLDATVEMIRGITVPVTGNKTFSINDAWSYQRNTATCVYTVPTNASVAFPINTLIQGFTAGQVASFVAASGVTINSDEGKLALRPNTGWSIKKVGTNAWDLIASFS